VLDEQRVDAAAKMDALFGTERRHPPHTACTSALGAPDDDDLELVG